ncbi:MAG: hypothetical protein J6S49_08705, partial [Erysipelotrichaceae bacterium]|nr:hypothetical protein [Erysipelotrichaceae bacterium]
PDRITLKGNGVIVISDQEIYFGENEEAIAGMKVYVGVESLDENYNSSKSNLIELTLVEGLNEQGAINTQGNNGSGNDTPGGNGQTGQSGSSGNSLIYILIGIGALLAGGAAFFFSKKKDTPTKSTNKNEKSDNEKDNFEPSFEDKSVVVCSKSEQLVNTLKDRHYLSVNQCEAEDVDDAIIENKPDILISDINSEEELNELLAKKKAFEEDKEKPDFALGLHVNDELLPSIKDRLSRLEADKQICGFAPYSASAYDVLVRLILPILKPDLKSDASLENLGKIADLLGIPGVSSVVGAFIAGRDIKSNLEEGELGVSGGAAIIGDIASILGFDKVAEVAGLVDDVDSIRSAFDSQAGANEAKNGALGAKDIVDVVKDLTDKG